MTTDDLLRILLTIDFPEKYWELCERYSSAAASTYSGQKAEVLALFRALAIEPRYDARDRSYELPAERIGALEWTAIFAKQRTGQEFLISGVGSNVRVGSNFAVLAYEAKRLVSPTFSRSPFSGPPPYPRPQAADSAALAGLIREFVVLVQDINAALRTSAA